MNGQSQLTYSPMQRYATLVSAILGFSLDGYSLLIISFVILPITKSFHTSVASLGVVFSLQLVFSMVGGVIFGNYADLIGRRRLLLLSIAIYSLGSLLSAFSWNVFALALFRSLVGIGLGGEWGVGMALYNEVWTAKRRALGGGIIQGSFIFGIMLAGVVARWALSTYILSGWRVALATGFLSLIPIMIVRLALPESKLWQRAVVQRNKESHSAASTKNVPVKVIFHPDNRKYTIIGLIMVACYMYAFYAIASIMPTVLTTLYKVPVTLSASITTWATFLGALTYVIIGFLGDVWGRKTAFLIAQFLSVVGFLLFIIFTVGIRVPIGTSFVHWPIFWAYLLFYMGSASFAVFGVWFSELYPTRARSTGISTIYMVGRGMSALAPIVAASSMNLGLLSGTFAAIVLFGLPWILRETRGVNLSEEFETGMVNN